MIYKYQNNEMNLLAAAPATSEAPRQITPPRPSENGTLRHITVGRAAIATPPEPI